MLKTLRLKVESSNYVIMSDCPIPFSNISENWFWTQRFTVSERPRYAIRWFQGKARPSGGMGVFLVVFFARLEGPQTRTIKCCIKWVLFQKLFVKDAFISRHDLVFLKSVWLHILTYDIFVSSLHIPAKCAISISWRYIPFPCSLGMHGFKANEFDVVVEVLLRFTSRITILGSSKCVNICCPCTKI